MKVKKSFSQNLKNGLVVRGDSLYCPLSFSLDSYGNCLTDCWHCYFRNLNYVWGQELKPLDIDGFEKKIINGLRNKNPKSSLAHCLAKKKTLRFGNKSDPFQEADLEYGISGRVLSILGKFKWSTVIQTKFTENLLRYFDIIVENKAHFIIVPIVSPGFERDWRILERERTTHPWKRLQQLQLLKEYGLYVGVNGEPFIPGYHEISEFEEMLKMLKFFGINRYNTYNFHFNAFVARRLNSIGIDIERIWFYNQDAQWRIILRELIDLAEKYDIILGCPDFVNASLDYHQNCNTCCSVDVPNPTTFNTHTWIRMIQSGYALDEILDLTWDGIGDYEMGKRVLLGESSKFYTLKDAGLNGLGLL